MSILTKEGYLLLKSNYSEKELNKIKDNLTVTPHLAFKIGNVKPIPFTVYQENNKYLSIPKYYGITNFGQPINKEIIGEPNDIIFNGFLRSNQLQIINNIYPKLQNTDGGLLCLGCGSGKCVSKNTIILMYDGTTKLVQNIKINDNIMGDDSTPRKILSITNGKEIMYKINIIIPPYYKSKNIINESYIVNESHILSLKNKNKIIDISVKEYLLKNIKEQNNLYGYRVPIIFTQKKIEIDPYILGYWLGNKNNKIIKYLIKKNKFLQLIHYKFKNYNINDFLKKYNLYKIKYIPNHYKCNSYENQLKLLAGIIDCNGLYYNNSYKIINKNEKLIDDIIFIIRSLGFIAIKSKIKKIYIISIYSNKLKDIPIKSNKIINFKKYFNTLNYKIKLEKLKIDDYYGFEIDGNRRFVLGDFTVTHNTVIALYIASLFKVKTLVIVHKSFLLNQWKQRAQEFTNATIGIIQQNKIDIDGKNIVIGMLQSIAKEKYDTEIFRDFGLVIFDEAHHAPSKYFSRALPIISCKKTLALSATPKRADKLEKVLYWYFGPILYQEAPEIITNLIVKIFKYNIVHKNFKEYKLYDGTINRPKTINKLIEINKRNQFIIDIVKDVLLEEGRKIIILSDRIEHLHILKELLDKLEITTTSFYIGGMKQKKLDESEKATVIFGTYSMASEALDIPELNTLVMTTPRKEIEQTVGRITRKKDHPVQSLIIDIVDQLSSFNRQGEFRKKFYIKKEFQINIYNVEENEIKIEDKNININEEINYDEITFID